MITGDIASDVKFLLIMLSIVLVPFLWLKMRGKNATDHEGRGEPPMELAEPTTEVIGLPGKDYPVYSTITEESNSDMVWLKKKNEEERRKKGE
jgi:hypothetical protein